LRERERERMEARKKIMVMVLLVQVKEATTMLRTSTRLATRVTFN